MHTASDADVPRYDKIKNINTKKQKGTTGEDAVHFKEVESHGGKRWIRSDLFLDNFKKRYETLRHFLFCEVFQPASTICEATRGL